MKDSMPTVLDNLSDREGHAVWQKGLVLYYYYFLLAT